MMALLPFANAATIRPAKAHFFVWRHGIDLRVLTVVLAPRTTSGVIFF